MKLYKSKKYHSDPQFNMTPMIDIVFLLIVFFMLVCQFISQENYKLIVPDDCKTVIKLDEPDSQTIAVNIYLEDNEIVYIVDGQEIQKIDDPEKLIDSLARVIYDKSKNNENPKMLLRAHHDLDSADIYPAIKAASSVNVSQIRLAAFEESQIQ